MQVFMGLRLSIFKDLLLYYIKTGCQCKGTRYCMFSTSLTFNILVLGEMTLDFVHVELAVVAVHCPHHLLEGRLTGVHPHAEPVGKGMMSQEMFER